MPARPLVFLLTLASAAMIGCRTPEDPARAELRLRLTQEAQLAPAELDRLRATVNQTIAGKRVRIAQDPVPTDMTEDQRTTVLGMLSDPVGMFDEGLVQEGGRSFRVLNAPGESEDSEIEASRRLWIETQTFEPRRFLFSYAFAGHGDYAFDLTVDEP